MIVLDNVTKSFGKSTVLNDINMKVNDCSIYGLIGYNGAGKTTLLNIVSGLYKTDSGKVTVDVNGKSVAPFDNPDLKRAMFYVTDNPFYFPNATLITMRNFYCGMYPGWSDISFEKLVDLFGIDPNKKINEFSKGMKRQAAIIFGLSSRARYLLLDESFDGLDPNIRNLVSNLLAEYIAETEATVIAASHNLYELENICDSVGMINGNRLIYSDDIDNLKGNINKYRVAVSGTVDAKLFNNTEIKFLHNEGNVYTFQSKEGEEKIKNLFNKSDEILLFESSKMTLNEIFIYETEGKENEIEGIFEK